MADIHYAPIEHPAAWTGPAIGGREGLTHRLSDAQLAALDALVARHRGRVPHSITRAEFSTPEIDALMAAVRHRVMDGNGAVVLSGIDALRYDVEDHARLYWGLGTHLGTGVVQGPRGDYVGHVQVEPGGKRGQTTDMELRSHTDFHEILSLYSLRTAVEGGESGAVSALAIHNVIARERPELLAPLYAGWYMDWSHRTAPADEKVPFFCNVAGKVSCFNNRVFMRGGRVDPASVPAELREALDFFDAVAQRPELRADFLLEPGEMLFWHNFLVLHSRRQFRDTPERRRLLLRLWLNVPNGRPMAEPIRRLTHDIDAGHQAMMAA